MRLIMGSLLLLVLLIVGGYFLAARYPYSKYVGWMEGKADSLYEIKNYRKIYLNPTGIDKIPPYQEDYVQLWKEFPLRNSLVPLPTRHPMFQTVPIIEMTNKKAVPHFGMIFQDPTGREISRVYILPNRFYQDHSQGQELFKLPYVRNKILNKELKIIWQDIFTYRIEIKEKPIDEMIYDLYILHLRSKILPQETIKYGLIKDGKQALIELNSNDKDYMVELVLTMDSGSIFSYILKTEKSKQESMKLRSKFLESITFSPVDSAISRFLYTEFKQLNYSRQVDQEGMLYLYSAWSQNPDNLELLKEMIYYLERGHNTKKQLKALYTYSFKRYGKTYTSRIDNDDQDNPELMLQRRIEVEERDLKKKAEEASNVKPPLPELSAEEKMNINLRKAKKEKNKEASDMTVH